MDGVEVIRLARQRTVPRILLAELLKIPANCGLLASLKSDIFHSFTVTIPSVGLSVALLRFLSLTRFKRHRIVVDWEDWWGRGGIWADYSGLLRIPGQFFEEKIPLLADAVTVVSDKLSERARSVGVRSECIFKIPNGANVEAVKPLPQRACRDKLGILKDDVVLCHLGFTDFGAFKLLVRAFEILAERRHNIRLLLVGSLPESHLNIVRTSTATRRIVYAGSQPYAEIPWYLGASNVLLLSMRDSIIEEARWPIRLGDYLAAGRPIVATDIGEVANILRESGCGLLARPNDELDFADQVAKVIETPDMGEQMGKQARELAEQKYAWNLIAKQVEEVYKQILCRAE